ncbi:MAG: hypothetical protein JW847_03845 [Candidatus Omnitrophica bacterium]|nr:hypothetical protein [Candidatus Omnitrophota bacterium]
MEFSYGQGAYLEGNKKLEGQILLSEHRLYLKDKNGDLAQTYVPLEKIERIRKTRQGIEIHVRPTIYYRFTALIKGERKFLSELTRDLVQRRGFRKRFLKNEWTESET